MTDGERLTIINALHSPIVTLYTSTGAGEQSVLKPNPRRFFVRFVINANIGQPFVYPKLTSGVLSTHSVQHNEQEFKFFDCPAITTGEFMFFSSSPGDQCVIIEDIFVGR